MRASNVTCSGPWPWVLAITALLAAGPARAGEAHYVIIFGAQLDATQPRYTHSWATYVRATDFEPCNGPCRLECFTISWMPQTLQLDPLKRPEPGANLDLDESLRWAERTGLRVSAWGPFQIDKEIYDRAALQFDVLHSGAVKYKMIDAFHRSSRVSNCIHAVSTVVGGYRLRVLSPSYGQTASYYLVQRYRPWMIAPSEIHEWVYAALGLDAHPTIRRRWNEHPRSGVFWGAVMRALGRPDPQIGR